MSSSIRVLLDGYFFDRAYGFGRYVRELAYALDGFADDVDLVLLLPDTNTFDPSGLVRRARIVQAPRRPFPWWEQRTVPRVARRHGCDLVHAPYQSTALAWPRSRTVATVHDLMFLRPQATAGNLVSLLAHFYRHGVFTAHTRYAAQVVAVSEATRDDLRRVANVDAAVVENVCQAFVEQNSEVPPAEHEGLFFLHRGDRGPHKNTRRVVEAFARLREEVSEARLLVYGGATDASLLEGLPSAGVTLLGRISDARLASLYRAAVSIVMPSLEEGFGLSIIEAFGFGTAVLTSDRSPMREVAGGGALLVDPTRVDAIHQAMRRLALEPETRRHLLEQGRQRYAHYSSARVAAALREVYRRARQA